MLHPILALLTAGLLSIHQYIPAENTNYIQYFEDVREVQASHIFPAANQSCLYLASIFISAGLEKTAGDLADSTFGDFLKQQLGNAESIQSFIGILNSPKYAERLKNYGLSAKTVTDFLKRICKEDFSPLDFSYSERQSVLDLIKNEIHILSEKELNSLGDFTYFGTTPIVDRKGELISALKPKHRKWISYDDIPKSLILAVVSAEDRRFFVHQGSDEFAISRIAKQLLGNQRLTGGSTLTMQLLKNMYFQSRSSQLLFFQEGAGALLLRKVREWYWAKPFENYFKMQGLLHKKKILEYYFNLVYFGNNIQGIEQASQVYFSKPAKGISLAESAYIATLLKAPNKYSNPLNYESLTKARRNNYVFTRMEELCSEVHHSRFLTKQKEVQSLMKEICRNGREKITRNFIEEQKNVPLPLWDGAEYVETHESFISIQRQISSIINKFDFQSSNDSKELTVETTIDKNLQQILFKIMRAYLDEHDQATEHLSQVEPIRNNRGTKAKVIREDIPYSLNYKLQSVLSSLKKEEVQWFYSIKLNPDSFSFDLKKLEKFLRKSNRWTESQIKEIHQKIQSELKKKTASVGEAFFIKLEKKGDFSLYNLDQILKQSNFSRDKIKRVRSGLSPPKAQELIYKRALRRIYQTSQRDYLEPILYLSADTILNKSLERLSLPKSHLAHLSHYQSGDFFWVKKTSNSLYKLQGEKIQGSALIMNSKTGELLARFDGYNPKNNYFYRASQAQRQIASLIKPFAYLYALDRKDFHPQSNLNNKFISIPIDDSKHYTPKNNYGEYEGWLSLSQALVQSQNIATVSLIDDDRWEGSHWRANLNELMSFLKGLELYQGHNQTLYPSFILGSEEESLSQMVSAFSLFANGAYIAKPYLIRKLKNYQGFDIYKSDIYTKAPDLIKPSSLFQIQALLLQVVNRGTASRTHNFPYLKNGNYRDLCYNNVLKANHQSCFGGKTGTSDEKKDLWFIGFSQDFVIGIWLGYDIKRPTAWDSSKLVDIFNSIVEQGMDYLPPIKPVLTPRDQPMYLEKREVFGNKACSNPIESAVSYVIYTEKNSEKLKCRTKQKPSAKEYGICECKRAKEIERDSRGNIIKETIGYTLDITYKGKLYENLDFWKSLSECNKNKKLYIDKNTKVRLCP